MLKVVIVDDEPWVSRLISKLILWKEIGMELVGEINDGNEAYKSICQIKPDVVITDIRMPGLDGISLIKKLKEANIDSKFIVISGYQDFNYAQQAVKYGVKDYILKPIEEDELNSSLMRLKDSILTEQKRLDEETKLKILIEESLDKLREQFFSKLLFEDSHMAWDVDEINKEYKLSFVNANFQVIVFKLDSLCNDKENEKFDSVVLAKVTEILKAGLEKTCFAVYGLMLLNSAVFILNYSSEKQKSVGSALESAFNEAVTYVQMYKCFNLTAGVGFLETEPGLLKRSLKSAMDSIQCRIQLGANKILDISRQSYSDIKIDSVLPVQKEREFVMMAELLDTEGIEKFIKALFVPLFARRDINPCTVAELGNYVIKLLLKVIQEMNFKIETYLSGRTVDEAIDNCKSYDELLNCVLTQVMDAVEQCRKIKMEKNSRPVEVVKEYVSKHYSEPISLTDAANLVYLNPTYFSEMFKKETGKNFSEYLIDFRMETAKSLLKDIRYNVSDVAEMVGYKDVNHFCKMFKKIYNINAGQYKKLYT